LASWFSDSSTLITKLIQNERKVNSKWHGLQSSTCGLIAEYYRVVNICLNFSKSKYLMYTGNLSVTRYLLRCSSLLFFFASSNFYIHFGCYANAPRLLRNH